MNREVYAKRLRDFHILEVGRANCSAFTINDKEIAAGDPYFVDPNNFDLFFMEKNPEYKEKMFLIRNVLEDPELFETIVNEVSKKVVGETRAIKVILLCSFGRLVENHQVASFNLLVNSESGSGKDYVTSKTLEIIPQENYVKKTRISPTVFNYWHNAKFEPDWTWAGKVFYCEDIGEGVLNSDVFKVMCSSGSSATITVKQRAVDIEINGKPVVITTTASANPNPEMVRRFVLLPLDESVSQTKEIMRQHAKFRQEGTLPEYNRDIVESQKMLNRVKVKIPFAEQIYTFFPEQNILMRTNFPRFLDFIAASTSLHQYQRKKDDGGFYLAEWKDYEIARECFLTLFSNKYMIPLTRNQKQILSYFESDPNLNGPVTHLYNVTGINFISDRALETNLKQLVKYGILTTTTGKDVLNREITYYLLNRGYSTNEKLNLPTSDEINIKKIDKQEEGSISSETSVNKGVIEDIEVKEGERSTTICKTCGLNEGKLTQDGISFYCLDCIKIERGPVIT